MSHLQAVRIPSSPPYSRRLRTRSSDSRTGVRNGASYRYFVVPPAVVAALIAAESKGAYFNCHIRGRFRYQRLV